MQCKIRRFDMSSVKPNRIALIVGKRGCGKSTLLKDLLFHLKDRIDFVLAMCPTMESAEMLRQCMPSSCVFDRFSPSKVDQLVATAQHLASIGKKRSIALILDDCMYDRSVLKGPSMRALFFNGRHLGITFICCAQYMMDLQPDLRCQIDYLFTMKENIISNRMKLWKYLFGSVQNFDDFCAIMDRCTQNYECLCLDNTLQTGAVQDCVFWYKASVSIPSFRIGNRVFYALEDKTRRPHDYNPTQMDSSGSGGGALAAGGRGRRATMQIVKEEEDADAER
jgi:hypothetical protein